MALSSWTDDEKRMQQVETVCLIALALARKSKIPGLGIRGSAKTALASR
jgi:hypothetical protein